MSGTPETKTCSPASAAICSTVAWANERLAASPTTTATAKPTAAGATRLRMRVARRGGRGLWKRRIDVSTCSRAFRRPWGGPAWHESELILRSVAAPSIGGWTKRASAPLPDHPVGRERHKHQTIGLGHMAPDAELVLRSRRDDDTGPESPRLGGELAGPGGRMGMRRDHADAVNPPGSRECLGPRRGEAADGVVTGDEKERSTEPALLENADQAGGFCQGGSGAARGGCRRRDRLGCVHATCRACQAEGADAEGGPATRNAAASDRTGPRKWPRIGTWTAATLRQRCLRHPAPQPTELPAGACLWGGRR